MRIDNFQYFSEINLTISAFPQYNIQKLFCVNKALYFLEDYNLEWIKNLEIKNILITSQYEMSEMIKETINMFDKDFFNNYKIHNFKHNSVQNSSMNYVP